MFKKNALANKFFRECDIYSEHKRVVEETTLDVFHLQPTVINMETSDFTELDNSLYQTAEYLHDVYAYRKTIQIMTMKSQLENHLFLLSGLVKDGVAKFSEAEAKLKNYINQNKKGWPKLLSKDTAEFTNGKNFYQKELDKIIDKNRELINLSTALKFKRDKINDYLINKIKAVKNPKKQDNETIQEIRKEFNKVFLFFHDKANLEVFEKAHVDVLKTTYNLVKYGMDDVVKPINHDQVIKILEDKYLEEFPTPNLKASLIVYQTDKKERIKSFVTRIYNSLTYKEYKTGEIKHLCDKEIEDIIFSLPNILKLQHDEVLNSIITNGENHDF